MYNVDQERFAYSKVEEEGMKCVIVIACLRRQYRNYCTNAVCNNFSTARVGM